MADKSEQTGAGNCPDAAFKAVFSRLGIPLDDENGGDAEMQIAALNGFADRYDALMAERSVVSESAEKNSDALAKIAAGLIDAGVAPQGDYEIADVVGGLLASHDAACEANRELTAQVTDLKRQLAAQKGQTTRARSAAAEALERNPKVELRALPAEPPQVGHAEVAMLLELIDAAGDVQVVAFADGVEVAGLPALQVRGGATAFLVVSSGLCLRLTKWEVPGPDIVHGWGLYLDGELTAYRARDSQLVLGQGQTFNLASDVIF